MDLALFKNINHEVAAEFGGQLSARRSEEGLSVNAISKLILLSSNQINGIEMADFSAFYGPDFYVVAVKKYAELLHLTFDHTLLVKSLLDVPSMLVSTSLIDEKKTITTLQKLKRKTEIWTGNHQITRRRIALILLLIACFFIVRGYYQAHHRASEVVTPIQSLEDNDSRPVSSAKDLTVTAPEPAAESVLTKIDAAPKNNGEVPQGAVAQDAKASPVAGATTNTSKNTLPDTEDIHVVLLSPTWIEFINEDGTKSL